MYVCVYATSGCNIRAHEKESFSWADLFQVWFSFSAVKISMIAKGVVYHQHINIFVHRWLKCMYGFPYISFRWSRHWQHIPPRGKSRLCCKISGCAGPNMIKLVCVCTRKRVVDLTWFAVADRLNTDINRLILSWPLVSSTTDKQIKNKHTYIHTYIYSTYIQSYSPRWRTFGRDLCSPSTSTIFIFTLSSEPSNFRGVLFDGSENSMLKPAFYIHT